MCTTLDETNAVMSTLGKVLRWILASPILLVLVFVLVVGISVASVSRVLTNAEHVPQWIAGTGIYDHAFDVAVELASSQLPEEGTAEPTDDEGPSMRELSDAVRNPESPLGASLRAVSTPVRIEGAVTTIIRATYAWLEGRTPTPEFTIALIDDRQTAINLLSATFTEKVRALPTCDASFVPPPDFNPLEATCAPSGYDPAEVSRFITEHADDPQFQSLLDNMVLRSDALIRMDPRTSQQVQLGYRLFALFPLMLAAAVVLLTALLMLLIPHFPRGVTVAGFVIGCTALVLLLGALIGAREFGTVDALLRDRIPDAYAATAEQYLTPLLRSIWDDLAAELILLSSIGVVVGAALAVTGILRARAVRARSSHQ